MPRARRECSEPHAGAAVRDPSRADDVTGEAGQVDVAVHGVVENLQRSAGAAGRRELLKAGRAALAASTLPRREVSPASPAAAKSVGKLTRCESEKPSVSAMWQSTCARRQQQRSSSEGSQLSA